MGTASLSGRRNPGIGVYLPGSWPDRSAGIAPDVPNAEDVERLMRPALSAAADRLSYLGDGEPGRGYLIYLSESLRREPGIAVAREGDWSTFRRRTVLRTRRPLSRLPELDPHLRYARFARRSLPVLRKLRPEYRAEDLALLVGIPSPLSAAAVTFGPQRALLYQRAFRRATVRQIAAVSELGPDVAFQVEATVETVAVASVPSCLRKSVSRLAADNICRLAALAPPGTRFTVHLCLGSLHGVAAARPDDSRPLVMLANAIGMGWPPDRRLELVHLPLAPADSVASIDPQVYAPLAGLALPETTTLALGMVTADQPWPAQVRAVELASDAVAKAGTYRLSVAPSCGLLSKTEEVAAETVRRTARLAEQLTAPTGAADL